MNGHGESHWRRRGLAFIAIALASVLSNAQAEPQRKSVLRVGDPAPRFVALDDQGRKWSSDEHVRKQVLVIYFYPSDMTASSRMLACRFRDQMSALSGQGVELIGVSGDSVSTHRRFKQKHKLTFTLLADTDGHVARAFGVTLKESQNRTARRPKVPKPRVTISSRVFAIGLDGKVAFQRVRVSRLSNIDLILDLLARNFWSNREDKRPIWQPKTAREWLRVLSREQFRVTRRRHTERAFTGKYWNTRMKGSYRCVCCGRVLFSWTTKFKSGTGWPSFWNPVSKDVVKYVKDKRKGRIRVEVLCSRCGAHLGHVFPDGPRPTGRRFCINSASLVLQKQE